LVIKLLAEIYDIILPYRRRRRSRRGIENPISNIFGYLQSIQLLLKKSTCCPIRQLHISTLVLQLQKMMDEVDGCPPHEAFFCFFFIT
jgi:hypothetical protein